MMIMYSDNLEALKILLNFNTQTLWTDLLINTVKKEMTPDPVFLKKLHPANCGQSC